MGQLISIPVKSDAAASDLDHHPKTISECILRSGKVSVQLFHDFKKRSYEELDQHVADLLFTNSLLSKKKRMKTTPYDKMIKQILRGLQREREKKSKLLCTRIFLLECGVDCILGCLCGK
jgi:hypothetical protein